MKAKLFLFIFVLLCSTHPVYCQNAKADKILMTNGEIKEGQVTAIDDETVKFVHINETLPYTLKKINISKTEFASGRIEVFHEVEDTAGDDPSLKDHHNKVAVLPVIYVRDGQQLKGDIMEKKAQSTLISLMQGHVGIIKIQDPTKTNNFLAKNGINDDNYDEYTMPELANLLGVEYVVKSILSISQKGTTTYHSNYSTATSKQPNKASAWNFGSSSSTAEYRTNVDMYIYNDNGELVFTKSKESFWPSEDVYELTLKYLIKRTPVYTK